MDVVTLARLQFGITTVYHFFFVPITIGMSLLVAIMQTLWVRTGNDRYLRLTKFYGKLFLINFALGVATGIVQEFQFGMNWSDYSRFVGDVFGAPLALEGLLAFFLESTFLGMWIFGWDRIPRRLHLASIWLASLGTWLSAIFILAANSWMQNPVGFTIDPGRGRAELTDFVAVLTNPVLLAAFPHQILACLMTSGALVAAVSGWHLWRIGRSTPPVEPDGADEQGTHRWALRFGAVVMLVAGLGVVVSGDLQGKVMYEVQPMKMASAEALYETESPAPFSLFTIGTLDGSEEIFSIKASHVLSFLATGTLDGEVVGINELNQEYRATYRDQLIEAYGIDVVEQMPAYNPNIAVTYWSFRMMMGLGIACMLVGLATLWVTRGHRLPIGRWWTPLMVALPLAPLLANSFGWIFTEMGRQPWLVFGLMPTFTGVSPGTTATEVVISLTSFTLVYGVLGLVEVRLLLKYIRAGLPEVPVASTGAPGRDDPSSDHDADEPLSFAY